MLVWNLAGTSSAANEHMGRVRPATSCVATPPAGTDALYRGVDVSFWDASPDWSKVAASGVTFVIAKATEGLTYDDPTYPVNMAGAAANGLRFTAYEFMDPTGGTTKAVADANHFVDYAALGDRNLVPVLDVERTNGFSPSRLRIWMKAWLHRVYVRLGVKATIYTSPSFWATSVGDSRWFADHGYRLWIANWGVAAPTVPAKNWNGDGWTFWQWSDCGRVPGIKGSVDLDLYPGRHFHPVLIKTAKAAGG